MINLKSLSTTIIITLIATSLFAQKPTLTQLTKRKVDSLKKIGADAILWYESYCGDAISPLTPNIRILYLTIISVRKILVDTP